MTSHRDCLHPSTKAARAKCRKDKAEIAKLRADMEAENQIYHDTYIAPYLAQEEARKKWEKECLLFASAHINSAEQNADDTAREEGFELYSLRWCEVALSSLHSARDLADRCWNAEDPEEGQSVEIEGATDWQWVDRIEERYDNGWTKTIRVVDREGNRTVVPVTSIQL